MKRDNYITFLLALILFESVLMLRMKSEENLICQSCISIIKTLKNLKTSKYCDNSNIDKMMCYEIYYQIYYFKPNYFFATEEKENILDLENNDCHFCTDINKCTYSECSNRISKVGLDFKQKVLESTNMTNISTNNNVTIAKVYNNTRNNQENYLEFLELDSVKPSKNLLKAPIDRNSNNYADILISKLENILSYLDFMKTIKDNNNKLRATLLKFETFAKHKKQLNSTNNGDKTIKSDTNFKSQLNKLKTETDKISSKIKDLLNKNRNITELEKKINKHVQELNNFGGKIRKINSKMIKNMKSKIIKHGSNVKLTKRAKVSRKNSKHK